MNTEIYSTDTRGLSLRNYAIISGIGLLLMAIVAPIANFAILHTLFVPDSAGLTFSNLTASENLFRIGIGCFLIVAILDIIVAWALYYFLKPVNSSLSLLAACFRIVYAAILIVVLNNLLEVLQLIHTPNYLSSFSTDQIETQVLMLIQTFTRGWEFGLIIFSIHLLILGYLFFKEGFMRKVLGVLLILSGLGYLTDGAGKLLSSGYSISISMFTFIGEILLIFWLLIQGWKIKK